MTPVRLKYLDIASGIMIVWLLLFHALYPMIGPNITGKVPFLYFFMPWFFYKSGMMFSIRKGTELLRKDYNKLIVTFIIWSTIGYLCYLLWQSFYYHDITLRTAFYVPARSFVLAASIPMNGALWFIPILFCVRQISNFFLKRIHPLTIALVAISLYSICLLIHFKFTPAWISSTLWGTFCFVFGYYLNNIKISKIGGVILTILSITIYLISLFTTIPSVYSIGATPAIRLIWLMASIVSCIAFNKFCQWLSSLSNSKTIHNEFPVLSYIGKHSMTYYVGHYIIFRIAFDSIAVIKSEWYSSWQGLLITLVAYVTILTAICIIIEHSKKPQIIHN